MKPLLAIAFVFAIAAASHRTIEEHAAKGDWLGVLNAVMEIEKTDRIEAAATMVDVTLKYATDDSLRRAANLDWAVATLEPVIRDDKYNVRALTLLATIRKDQEEHATPSMKETYARLARFAHENAVDAAEHVRLKPDEPYAVGFIQDETVAHPVDPDGTLVLRRAPFTIRVVTLTPRTAVQINAAASDVNFKRVRAGYRMIEDCQTKNRIPFCLGSEFPETRLRLNVDDDGAHWIVENGWSKVTREGSFKSILDRDIVNLSGTPVEQTTVPRLYITVLQRSYDNGVLKEGDIRRIAVRFR